MELPQEDPDARPHRLVVWAAAGMAIATGFATIAAIVSNNEHVVTEPDNLANPSTSLPATTSLAPFMPPFAPPTAPSTTSATTTYSTTTTHHSVVVLPTGEPIVTTAPTATRPPWRVTPTPPITSSDTPPPPTTTSAPTPPSTTTTSPPPTTTTPPSPSTSPTEPATSEPPMTASGTDG